MGGGGLDAVQLGLISGVVTTIIKMVQTANPGGIKPRTALAICVVSSGLGVAAWVVSQPVAPDNTWVLGLVAAWAQIAAASLGLLVGVSSISQGGQVNNALSGTGSGAPAKG